MRRETDRSWRLFKLKPAQFNNSEAVFRLYTMEHVFRVRFNIKYDPLVQKITEGGKPWTTSDSTEVFIHGILGAKRTGTCSSLPTFAIAVGRRLGYPLKLVLAPNHTLYRWDDGNEVFNMQHTEAGGDVRTDEYFYEWPRKWDEIDYAINERTQVWLHSMTPKQEVSKFLCNRAIFLRDIRKASRSAPGHRRGRTVQSHQSGLWGDSVRHSGSDAGSSILAIRAANGGTDRYRVDADLHRRWE